MDYQRNYYAQRAIGEEFERFVIHRLQQDWRVTITRCETEADQLAHGDTFFGLEIKYDDRLIETNNLCIEYAERHAPTHSFVDGGILAESSAWLYGIGNRREFFIFSKRHLQRVYDAQRLLEPRDRIFAFYETPTSRGFLIPRRRIPEHADVMFYWGVSEGVIDADREIQSV